MSIHLPPETHLRNLLSRTKPNGDCMEWQGPLNKGRYSNCVYRIYGGRLVLGHRIAWAIANGRSPGRLCVLHRCDNPPCINPDHLFLGTHKDNYDDMASKGRARLPIGGGWRNGHPALTGSRHPNSKITESDVAWIRRVDAERSISRKDIAKSLGVDLSNVWQVIHRKAWKHVP